MRPTSQITLTSKLGKFTFSKDVPLALAKLLRDSVTGQYFNPQSSMRIRDEESAREFVYETCSRDVAHIPFNLEFAEEYRPMIRRSVFDLLEEELELERMTAEPYLV